MQHILPGKMDRRVLKVIESFLTLNNLDDLLESTLFHLLDVEHVKRIEILLFNANDRLISVAAGRNLGLATDRQKDIVIQSWLMESPISHPSANKRLPPHLFSFYLSPSRR